MWGEDTEGSLTEAKANIGPTGCVNAPQNSFLQNKEKEAQIF